MWWTLVTFLVVGMTGLELLVYREDRAPSRAAGRRFREANRTLRRSDRREVVRAVRRGRAVNDPRLAPAAVAMAEMIMTQPPRRPLRVVNNVLGLAWVTTPAVFAVVHGRWGWALFLWSVPLMIVSGLVFIHRTRPRAEDAFTLNQEIIARRPIAGPSGTAGWYTPEAP